MRFGSKIVDRRTSEMLAEAERLAQAEDPSIEDFRLTQGSLLTPMSAPRPAPTAGPGPSTCTPPAYTSEQKEIIGMALRTVGFASWRRRAIPASGSEHWHGIAMDTEGLPPVAARQVKSYLNGRDGLAGNGKDPDPRPKDINTWEEYQKEQGAELEQVPVATAAGQDRAGAGPVRDRRRRAAGPRHRLRRADRRLREAGRHRTCAVATPTPTACRTRTRRCSRTPTRWPATPTGTAWATPPSWPPGT